jgi:hypothetical protein
VVVLDDGTYYGIYLTNNSGTGFLQGTGSTKDGKFTSTNGLDFESDDDEPFAFKLSTTVTPKSGISGSIEYTSLQETGTLELTYDASYEAAVPLASLAGTYIGNFTTLESSGLVELTVESSGTYRATDSDTGCVVDGALKPRGATAVFDLTVSYDQATCGTALKGTGVAYVRSFKGNPLLWFAGVNSSRSDYLLGVAQKQIP